MGYTLSDGPTKRTGDPMPQTRTEVAGVYECETCHQLLPLNEFYTSNSRLGHQRECRGCGMERRRQRTAARFQAAIAQAMQMLDLADLTINETRTFGIEIECYVPATRSRVASAIRQAIHTTCRAERYNHHDAGYWKVVTDATVNSHHAGSGYRMYAGMEIVSRPLCGKAGMSELQAVMAAIRSLGGIIDRRCGMHVHHAARDLTVDAWKRLFGTYLHFEEALDSIMPPSRRGPHGSYCSGLRGRDLWDYNSGSLHGDPYWAIASATSSQQLGGMFGRGKVNEAALSLHGTVELRHHGGSLSFEKASNWIALTQNMVEVAAAGNYAPPTTATTAAHCPKDLGTLLDVLDASEPMREFFNGRQQYFAHLEGYEDRDREQVAA